MFNEIGGIWLSARGQSTNGFVACKHGDYFKVNSEMGQADRNMAFLESRFVYLKWWVNIFQTASRKRDIMYMLFDL